jgi:hypothetical protein
VNCPTCGAPVTVASGDEGTNHYVLTGVMVDPALLMYAFRYALGRESYAVADVARVLITNVAHLRPDWRGQIVRDIDDAIAEDRAGSASDVARWQDVKTAMWD